VCIRLNFLAHGKLTIVKSLRIWLLVLLAVLLPLRSALAAAMMCHVAGTGVQTEVQMAEQAHDHGQAHSRSASGDHHGAEPTSQAADHHDFANVGDPADKCNLCSAFCSVTGMVSGTATTAEPPSVATVFPHLYAPPPSFVSDGQERPPRSI
jgi:uncharacterized Fe-S radical SAM superfamily protein PflX